MDRRRPRGRRLQANRRLGPRATAVATAVVVALMALSFAASAITITITSPPAGSWTASSIVTVTGTATGPGMDTAALSSNSDFAGGLGTNATVSADTVTQTFPDIETYRYEQPFTGLGGLNTVDDHWTWNFNSTWWEVSTSPSLSSSPPALAHSTASTESLTWMAALPGNATEGWVGFRYFCEANAFMNVYASTTGHTAAETGILSTGAAGETGFWYNVSSMATGSDMLVLRFEVGASAASSSYCSVDNFVTEFNFTRSLEFSFRMTDDFAAGPSGLWSAPQAGWAATNTSTSSPSPPAYGHTGMAPTSTRLNLAFPNPITGATLAFSFQCEANASLSAFLSSDGTTESTILAGLRGAPTTAFLFDASVPLGGQSSLYLRLDADAVGTGDDLCAIDDLDIAVTYRGHLGLMYDGSYESPIVDLGITADLAGFGWWGQAPANTTLDVYERTSLNNLTFTDWSAVPTGGGPSPAPTGRYVQFRANFTSLGGYETAVVDALFANFSAIVSVEWSTNGVLWYLATGMANWSADVPLGPGTNTINVRVRDTTGALETSQIQVSRDNIPPGPSGKPQAPGVTNGSSVAWSWAAATDVGVGVDHYLVDVGLSRGGFELAQKVQVTGTNYTHMSVPDGVTVYLTVRSVDRGGLVGQDNVTSDGTVVDRTPPGATTVQGPPEFSNAADLTWTWTRPSDPGTGVASYRVRLGTTAGDGDVFDGNVTTTSYTLTSVASGTNYFATIIAVDGAGNAGPAATSSGTTADRDAPTGPASVTTAATLTNATTVTWEWDAATDVLSGVSYYHVEVGTTVGGNDTADVTTNELTFTLGYVESGTVVFFGVTAIDVAGNAGTRVEAPSVHSDSTAPGNVTIMEINPFVANSSVTVEWTLAEDGPTPGASGVDHYLVRVRHGTDVTDTSVTERRLTVQLADGATYTVEVLAVDGAQNRGPISTVTFTGDLSGPTAPATVTARVSNALGPSFTATWNATVDAASGLSEYRVSVGTSPGGTDIASSVRVTRLNFTWTGTEGTDYWVTVWAVDKLGNEGPSVQTAGPVSFVSSEGGGFLPGLDGVVALLALSGVALALAFVRRAPPRRGRGMA